MNLSRDEMLKNISEMVKKYKPIIPQENKANILKFRIPDKYPNGSLWIQALTRTQDYDLLINGDVASKLLTYSQNLLPNKGKVEGNGMRWKNVSFNNVEKIMQQFCDFQDN